ncbi:hypothetical protein DZS_23340 [Dickeya ananatis]
MRIGIDLGGTKIEVIALTNDGEEAFRHRVATPRHDYRQTLLTIASLVEMAEKATGQRGSVGIGIPGTLSPVTGRVKNANSVWLNQQPLDQDLAQLLGDQYGWRMTPTALRYLKRWMVPRQEPVRCSR